MDPAGLYGPPLLEKQPWLFFGAVVMAIIGAALALHMSMPINPAPYRMAAILAAFGLVFVTCGNALAETIHMARMTGLRDALSNIRNGLAMIALAATLGAPCLLAGRYRRSHDCLWYYGPVSRSSGLSCDFARSDTGRPVSG